jgi:hypothetical protein
MRTDDGWVNFVKGTIRAEMTRRQMTYDDLAEKLEVLGVKDTPVNLTGTRWPGVASRPCFSSSA